MTFISQKNIFVLASDINCWAKELPVWNVSKITHISTNHSTASQSLTNPDKEKFTDTLQWYQGRGRGWGWGGREATALLQIFGKSVNPIPTWGGQIISKLPLAPPNFFTFQHHCTSDKNFSKKNTLVIQASLTSSKSCPKSSLFQWFLEMEWSDFCVTLHSLHTWYPPFYAGHVYTHSHYRRSLQCCWNRDRRGGGAVAPFQDLAYQLTLSQPGRPTTLLLTFRFSVLPTAP